MSAVRMYQRGVCLVTAALCAFAPFASAQDANVVLLESFDKSIAVSGELIEATNGQYKVSTVAGVISIDVNSVSCSGDACPAVVPNFSSGAQVRLTSNDGAVDISGNITDIIDGQYVVDNAVLGTLSIGTEVVNCAGPGCPQGLRFADETTITTEAPVVDAPASNEETAPVTVPVAESDTQETPTEPADNAQTDTPVADATTQDESLNASFSFAGSDTVGFGLLPLLLKDYAEAINATADTRTISETQSLVRYIDSDANEISSAYVDATGSGDATDALEIKAAVFGMTSRQIRDEEASRLIASGSSDLRNTDNETVIAVDSLAVITHPSNPVSRLSIAELAAIYLGQIDNWSQVGGLDAPITVLSREDGSSTRGVFENVIFDGEEQALAQRVTYPGGDNPEMAAAVKEDPLAIGYVGLIAFYNTYYHLRLMTR